MTNQAPRTSTWRELIEQACDGLPVEQENQWLLIEPGALRRPSKEWLDTPFVNDFGHSPTQPFILWTDQRVYFPVVYDGRVSVAWLPRHQDHRFNPRLIDPSRTAY